MKALLTTVFSAFVFLIAICIQADLLGVKHSSPVSATTQQEDEPSCWEYPLVTEHIGGIDFDENGNAWAVGSKGLILYYGRDSDWRRLSIEDVDLTAVATVDENRALVISSQAELFDLRLPSSLDKQVFDGFAAIDACVVNNRAFVVGAQGKIYRSQVSGLLDWKALNSTTQESITNVACSESSIIFATENNRLFMIRDELVSLLPPLPSQLAGQTIKSIAVYNTHIYVVGGACTHDLMCRGFVGRFDIGQGVWSPVIDNLPYGVSSVVAYSDDKFGLSTFGRGGQVLLVDTASGFLPPRIGSTQWLAAIDRDVTTQETWAVGSSGTMLVCDDRWMRLTPPASPSPSATPTVLTTPRETSTNTPSMQPQVTRGYLPTLYLGHAPRHW